MSFVKNTDVLIEGSSNLFHTEGRARSAVVDNSIDGSVTNKAPSQKAVQDALDLKLNSSLKGSANGLAELGNDGKIPSNQLPAIALTDVHVVADTAARDAISPKEEGDVAITQDSGKSWIYSGSAWLELTAAGYVLSVNGQTGVVSLDSDDVSEGGSNLYHTVARARSAAIVNSSSGSETDQGMSVSAAKQHVVDSINAIDTDDIEEGGSNLYFSNARAKSAAVVNSSAGSETDQAMSVSAAKQHVVDSINALDTDDIEEGSNLYYTSARANSDFDTRLATKSTSNLTEGSNLYYTSARANSDFDTRLALKSTSDVAEGSNLYYTSARANSDFDTRLALKSTSDLAEGSNLYYTQARFDSALSGKSTSNLSEGSNLYYTQARFDSAFSGKSTSDLSEGSNQYHTTSRARSAAVVNSSAGSETDQAMSVSAGKSYSDAAKLLAQKLMGPVDIVNSNLSLTDSHKYVSVDCSGGAKTITLPSTSGLAAGRHYMIKDKKMAASSVNYIRIQREGSNGEKIDGQNYYDIVVAGEAIMVMWDGSDWLIS